MSEQKKEIKGTREWAVAEINCCRGCSQGCRYCYARYDQVVRKKHLNADRWLQCQLLDEEVGRQHPLYPGQVMFPTAHDIVPENLEACVVVIRNLLKAGNRVLIVSKPHLGCISRLCSEFATDKKNILFRFTITARKTSTLRFWEPFAPTYIERKSCLEHAYCLGFATSVSIEPMLDTNDVVGMVHELLPSVSHSVWLGKMNKIETRVSCDSDEVKTEIARIVEGQKDEHLLELYGKLSGISKVFWKDSIKKILGLPLMKEAGQDM